MTSNARGRVYWAQALHFYQPPTQEHDVLRRVVEESYRPLLACLDDFPGVRVAININGVLLELLEAHGFGDVIERLKGLIARGQVDLLASGRFHPIFPLLTAPERDRSLRENSATAERLLEVRPGPCGFFPPELAFDPGWAGELAKADVAWVLLAGVAHTGEWPTAAIAQVAAGARPLPVLFRDDERSNRIAFRRITAEQWLAELAAMAGSEDRYVVTAMDAETFGHHHHGWEREFLAAAYGRIAGGDGLVATVAPGELLAHFPLLAPGSVGAASWSTSTADLASGNPFPLWRDPANAVHDLQWHYVDLVREALADASAAAEGEAGARWRDMAETVYQPALHSCQFWWASGRPWWEPIMVQRGLALLTQALLYATAAIEQSPAAADQRRRAAHRLAAANDVRARLERLLFAGELR